jgi:hypothetical protein
LVGNTQTAPHGVPELENCSDDVRVLPGARARDNARNIWRGLVRYANADLINDKRAVQAVKQLVSLCLPWQLRNCGLQNFQDLKDEQERTSQPLDQALQRLAIQYQPTVRHILFWLTEPHSAVVTLCGAGFSRPVEYLDHEAHRVQWKLQEAAVNFDKTSPHYLPYYFTRSVFYESIMAALAAFLIGQLDSGEPAPIRVCRRPTCGNFILPERVTRKLFCSALCGALYHQEGKTREEKRDRMWLYRLESESLTSFLTKLQRPEVKKRLRQIEEDWPDLMSKIKALRDRAAHPQSY